MGLYSDREQLNVFENNLHYHLIMLTINPNLNGLKDSIFCIICRPEQRTLYHYRWFIIEYKWEDDYWLCIVMKCDYLGRWQK